VQRDPTDDERLESSHSQPQEEALEQQQQQLAVDEHYMRLALQVAERALEEGEVPVGCVIVRTGIVPAADPAAPVSSSHATIHTTSLE